MSGVTAREARPDDLPRVVQLWRELVASEQALGIPSCADEAAEQAWRASFERHLGRFSFLWVAEVDGSVIGFLLTRLKTSPPYLGAELTGELCSICIDAAYRGRSVGRALVAAATERLQEAGATAIEVTAHEANAGSRAYWEALGFRPGFHVYRMPLAPKR